MSLKIEAGQPQSRRPPFGFGFQKGSRVVINGDIEHPAQKGRRFIGRESQIRCPDICHQPAASQGGNRQ